MPSSGTVATRVTRRVTDQRNASRISAGSACRCGPPAWNRSMGGCPVSACTRRLATCSAHAANQSLSWSSDSIPWCVASARNASRIYRLALSCFPRPCGEYGLLWTRRMPSTAHVRASHAFANGAPLSAYRMSGTPLLVMARRSSSWQMRAFSRS